MSISSFIILYCGVGSFYSLHEGYTVVVVLDSETTALHGVNNTRTEKVPTIFSLFYKTNYSNVEGGNNLWQATSQ